MGRISAKSSDDSKTLKLIEEVRKRRAEIQQAERPNWKTNCMFSDGDASKAVNLHVCRDLPTLAVIAGRLLLLRASFETGASELGLTGTKLVVNGFSVDDWLHDIKTKVSQIQIEDKKLKLATLESRLDSVITPELKRQMELEAIEQDLNSDA